MKKKLLFTLIPMTLLLSGCTEGADVSPGMFLKNPIIAGLMVLVIVYIGLKAKKK